MTAVTSLSQAARGFLLLASVVFLVGCEEREVVLPGDREPIRADTPPEIVNRSVPIRLSAQRVNSEWAQGFGTPAYRTVHPALSSAPQLIWSAQIGLGDSKRQRITAEPIVAAGRVYTLDANALVTATNLSGQTLWSADIKPTFDQEGDATGGGIAFHKGRLYVSIGYGDLVAMDAATGAVIWRQRLEATGSGQPTVVDGLVYLVAGDETGWALNTSDGTIAWQISATPSVANVLGAPAPAVSGKLAVFAFGSGDIIATFRKGGARRWFGSVAGQRVGRSLARISDATGAPVIVGNRVYVGNHSGRMVALDMEVGDEIWSTPLGALGAIWPAGGSLFAVTDTQELVRLDARNGEVIWSVDLPGFVKDRRLGRDELFAHYGPVVAGGRVIVVSNDGLMRSYAPDSGALVAQTEIPGGATTSPAVAGRTLYVVNRLGQLLAYR